MKQFYNIQYIPTGNIFNVAKEECDRLLKEEPESFRIVDKDYIPIKEEEPESTIQELVLGKPEEEEEEKPVEKKTSKKAKK